MVELHQFVDVNVICPDGEKLKSLRFFPTRSEDQHLQVEDIFDYIVRTIEENANFDKVEYYENDVD